jgi:hypothetical protein
MARRTRYISLVVLTLLAGFLAAGALRDSPGQDPDNQGGYLIVLLLFLVLLFMYVPLVMRSIAARLHRTGSSDSD